MYGITALVFFVVGGLEALLLRLQLASPNAEVLSADAYNQLFTMHGLTMVFMVVMPIAAAFSNYFLPIMLGARDVAFPRLNALSYWVFVGAGLFMYSSFILGGAPDGAWVGYAPLSTQLPETVRMDFFALGIQVAGIASIASSANFIATVFTMRAPGMTLMRMPVFAWMTLIVAFLLIFSLPIVGVGLWQMFFDRNFGSTFYLAAAGGDPLLWQHLFWLFGHPEVYVLILPAMGIVSEVLPTFSRKPLFGYAFVVFAGIAIAFLGFGVWSHHMFTAGMGPLAEAGFALSTMFIAVPTGIKIFNWIGTTWGGSLRLNTPMLFSLGFVAMFVIGGLSGVTHSIAPSDTQQHDSYYVVAHFHYVLFGGAIFGYMSGVYYWFPKWTGRMLNETVGKWHFWLMMLGFNLTFAPMHLLGLNGMPRRIYTYPEGLGFEFWNFIATLGAFTIAVSVLVFIVNLIWSKRKGDVAGPDPWDGRTLEWSIPSPPPEHNFDEVPVVRSVDDFWHRKYTEDEEGRLVPMPAVSGGALAVDETTTGGDDDGHGEIHMPSPSYYPALTAVGMTVSAFGLTYTPWGWIAVGVGAVTMLLGLFGWAVEPVTKEDQ
ncbi:MAG: cytochrome c oxidase subunit I [Acidimicrobiia bacterium]|nr:cytochrome c oxidase subunit I [Acidimicrobiia bacterium]